jgi:hypothetical protein
MTLTETLVAVALTIITVSGTSRLHITINLSGSGRPTSLRPEEHRQVVLQELPAAKILEEFTGHIASSYRKSQIANPEGA